LYEYLHSHRINDFFTYYNLNLEQIVIYSIWKKRIMC